MEFTLITDTIFVPDTTLIDHFITKYYRDTMIIDYSHKLKLVSPQCGFVTVFQLNQIVSSHNAIDSTQIKNPVIDIDNNEENIKIFI